MGSLDDVPQTPSDKAAGRWNSFHEETLEERHERYAELFSKLDVNNDGTICIDDLTAALKTMGGGDPGHAQRLMNRSDSNNDGKLDFIELMEYLTEHEKNLHIQFRHLDHKQDGLLDIEEILTSFRNLGIDIDKGEAQHLLRRMDEDKTNMINWHEFRNFLLLRPVTNIKEILTSWRHITLIDIGEDLTIPDDFTEDELKTGMWWRHLLAGGAAGAFSRTCTAPLDRIKVLLQVHGGKHKLTIVSGFQHLLKEGGIRGLWRGNGVNVIKIAPETAIKFMAYEQMKRLIKSFSHKDELGAHERFIAGASAGAISQTAIYPMEVLKTRLALRRTGQYSGIVDCASKIFRHEGLSVFYRGYVPNLIGIIPYAGIDLMIYETLKSHYIKMHPDNLEPDTKAVIVCGTTSCTCGQLASYPLALLRTRMQAKPEKNQSMIGTAKYIIHTDGFTGLYRGLVPSFMKVAPAVSISYVVYEHVRKLLGVKMT